MIKYLLLLTLIFYAFTSCEPQNGSETHTFEKGSTEQIIKDLPEHTMKVIVYDKCEYIIYKEDKDMNSSYGFMSHKGNCSNPIHQCL